MKKTLISLLTAGLFGAMSQGAFAAPELMDKVLAVVNKDVVLASQQEALVQKVKSSAQESGQSLPDDATLRKQALDRLIQESLQLQLADRQGLKISDTQLEQAIQSIAADNKMNLEQLFISPSVAWNATSDHVFGAALNLAHQRFSIRGLTPFAQPAASESSGNVHNQGTDTSNGVGVRLGWIGQIAPQWRLGATWASKIQGRFDKYKGLFAEQGGFDIPANYGVGISWQPAKDWTLGLDYQVIELSDVKSVGNPLSQLTAQGQLLGSTNGPGFGWKDVKVVKLGVIHQLNDAWTLRAGYSHATQPIPKSEAFLNVLAPGVVQDHLTAGFTWQASANSEWSAHYTHAFEKTVKGTSAIPDGYGGGDANIRLKEDIIGVSYGWKF